MGSLDSSSLKGLPSSPLAVAMAPFPEFNVFYVDASDHSLTLTVHDGSWSSRESADLVPRVARNSSNALLSIDFSLNYQVTTVDRHIDTINGHN